MDSNKTLSRRHFLKYLGAGAASLATAYSGLGFLTQKANAAVSDTNAYEQLPETFNPTSHTAADADQLLLAGGFGYSVLAAYGDKMNRQGDTLGFNSSYTSFFPFPDSTAEALLWVGHESAQYDWMRDRAKTVVWEQQKQLLYDQGGSFLHIKKDALGAWKLVADSDIARRISGLTPIELTGPARGTAAVSGATLVQGTFASRSGGQTLWNTQLTCENDTASTSRDAGLNPSHFGWVVEADPFDVRNRPLKHTALGRFNHGSAAMVLSADNRAVVYMGEDAPDGFIYKFVSKDSWNGAAGQDNTSLLSEGSLYAADLVQGRWIELTLDNVKQQLNRLSYQVPESMYKSRETLLKQFQTPSDVLAFASEAARIVGATPCDRPAELTVHPGDQAVFIACAHNDSRGNLHGHIIRLKEGIGSSLQFETFITGGRQSGFSSPGRLSFDRSGNLWVASDIPAERLNTGAWAEFKNNGLYLIHPEGTAQKTKQYASAPTEAALGGLSFSGNQTAVFLPINHPGESGAGTGNPTSGWQKRTGDKNPRSAVVVITRSL